MTNGLYMDYGLPPVAPFSRISENPRLYHLFSCRAPRCQPVTVPARFRTTHMLSRAVVLLVGDGGGHTRRRDTAASPTTSRDHLHT